MNDQHAPVADGVTQARSLLAEAAQEVERLENVAGQAFCRLTALAGMLPQLERLVVSHKPEAAKAVTLDAATARREAQLLLRYINTSEWSIGSLRNLVHFLALGL
ncbi:MAG TPA: hypothetical protein VH682_02245 [Gemmataceae bacterium]|jgi:hypothetical protein